MRRGSPGSWRSVNNLVSKYCRYLYKVHTEQQLEFLTREMRAQPDYSWYSFWSGATVRTAAA